MTPTPTSKARIRPQGRKTRVQKPVPDKGLARGHSASREVIACDLFAGAGGFSLGAYLAGVKVAAAVEWDSKAATTYRSNLIDSGLTETTLYERDISVLEPADLKLGASPTEHHCDILLGGPPCQGFSTHRIKDAGVRDPRNELLLRYFEYVKALRPTYFLVENVPGLLWPRHRDYVAAFYKLADASGYTALEPTTLNARDYGVPQNRRRVFILGFDRKRVAAAPSSWPPKATHADPSAKSELAPWVPASVAFKQAPPGDINNVHMRHGEELRAAFAQTPKNGGSRRDSGRVLPCHDGHVGHHDVYGRIDPKSPGPTMTTACINPSKGRFVHPTQDHGITLRQAARIQSFPDWFVFSGGLMSGGVQVGNAVPVLLAKALVGALRTAVLDFEKGARS